MKWFRKYHKWPGIILSIFILLFAISGIVLNHRKLFSSVDVDRKFLPAIYRYHSWNLAAVKSGLRIGKDSTLIYGNIGIWLTDTLFSRFSDFNKGFPAGIDNRKISSLANTRLGLFVGTLFGLYYYGPGKTKWERISLACREERINKVFVLHDSVFVLTRSTLLAAKLGERGLDFRQIVVPPAEDEDGRAGLFKTLWVIHSGEIYGSIGRLIIDFIAAVFIFLTLTGLVYFFMPSLLATKKESLKKRFKRFNRWSLRWHNITGSWLIPILLLTTLTGIFLRPPLLIAIANARVGKIKYSELDDPDPWYDKFRDVLYDDSLKRFVFATSQGFYYSGDHFRAPLKIYNYTPPLSVMGINVFENQGPGKYLVGSFSGIYEWDTQGQAVINAITKKPYLNDQEGKPFGDDAIAGYFDGLVFDYANGNRQPALAGGRLPTGSRQMPGMPGNIIKASPMSLWNTALEIHTCRIFQPLTGDFYILFIPVLGLAMVFVLVTGFFSWYLKKRKRLHLKEP